MKITISPHDQDAAFLSAVSPEWHHAWARLLLADAAIRGGASPASMESRNEPCGETWQYLGSYQEAGAWIHEFRHREHPISRRREVRHLPASRGWDPDKDPGLMARAVRATRGPEEV
jgi:hypothetical protein